MGKIQKLKFKKKLKKDLLCKKFVYVCRAHKRNMTVPSIIQTFKITEAVKGNQPLSSSHVNDSVVCTVSAFFQSIFFQNAHNRKKSTIHPQGGPVSCDICTKRRKNQFNPMDLGRHDISDQRSRFNRLLERVNEKWSCIKSVWQRTPFAVCEHGNHSEYSFRGC